MAISMWERFKRWLLGAGRVPDDQNGRGKHMTNLELDEALTRRSPPATKEPPQP